MISELAFSRGYSSFWQEYFPWLNYYIPVINADRKNHLLSPIDITEDPSLRSINNVVAFTHFKNICGDVEFPLETSFDEAKRIVGVLPRNNLARYKLTSNDRRIIEVQTNRLLNRYGPTCRIYPDFCGCGIVKNCYGDILKGETLIEIKAGERGIQPADLKQVILYSALNWANPRRTHNIRRVEIFNPRQGVAWNNDLSQFISYISDLSLEDVFDQLCKYLVELSSEIHA